MPVTHDIQTLNEVFIEPLMSALGASIHTRPSLELPDADWLRMDMLRVLEVSESGCAFLREHSLRLDNRVNIGNYFASHKSTRRENLVRETNLALISRVAPGARTAWRTFPSWPVMSVLPPTAT